jgi:predicted nucleic acid-binding protein
MAKNHIIYLDNCCYNRPYDDQSQLIIKLETEAKLLIQSEILNGNIDLVWSFILSYENNDNPYKDRKKQILLWEDIAKEIITFENEIFLSAKNKMLLGLKEKDALHIACAIKANADYFITTDKNILNKKVDKISIVNPIDFLRRYLDEN